MTTSLPNDHAANQPAEQSAQPAISHDAPHQWETASQPAAGAPAEPHSNDVAYMWGAPSQVIGDAEGGEEATALTTGRDPREERAAIPRAPNTAPTSVRRSGPLSRPAQSGPLSGPLTGPLGGGQRKRPSGCVLAAGGCLVALAALIALVAMSFGVVAALAAVSHPATTTTTRTLHVNGAPTLQLNSSAASVQITGDPTDSNVVTVTMSASIKTISYDNAHSIVQAIKLTTTQSGDTITIGLTDNTRFNYQVFFVRNVTLDITAPTHTSVSGEINAGALTTDDLTGALNVTNNAGAVTLHRMTFTGASTLRVSAGSLDCDGSLAQGATVQATVDAGSATFTLPRQSGAHLDASASSGSVTVIGWNASITRDVADASTTGDVGAHPTGSLTIHVNAGSVVVTLA